LRTIDTTGDATGAGPSPLSIRTSWLRPDPGRPVTAPLESSPEGWRPHRRLQPSLGAAQIPEISDELPDLGRLIAVVTLKSSKIARVVRDRRRIVATGDSL